MTGPTDVAVSFVDSLKQQPLALALVSMNLALLVLMYYMFNTEHTQRLATMKLVVEMQRETQVLLSKCVIPEKTALKSVWEEIPLPQSSVPSSK